MKASSYHQPATIDAKSIDGLKKAARALESAVFPVDVNKTSDDCFPVLHQGDAKPSQDVTGPQLLPRVELKSTLEEPKHLLGTVSCLTSSLERKTSPVEANHKPMILSHGINTAPMDVLNIIFEMVCCEGNQAAFDLSLVNKRFRDIVMRNPRLWNKINNLYITRTGLGQIRVSLKRSKDVGLNLELDFDTDSTVVDGVEILGIAVPEASRWENVSYLMESSYDEDRLGLFLDVSRYSTGLNLPRLISATLSYPGLEGLHEDELESIIDQSEPLMHFYTTWYSPNLTSLRVHNLFPRPFLHLAPPLTTLTLDIREGQNFTEFERVYDMDLLLELLRSSPLLENFGLHLESFTPSTEVDDHALPETVLPNLLTFEFTAGDLTAQSLLPFMKALRFPSLRNLHICVNAGTEIIEMGGDVWLDCVLPLSYEQYMNVEVFSYKTRATKTIADLDYRFSYDVPFAKLHNLRSITLETPCLKPNIWKSCRGAWTIVRLPDLKDIHFVRCDALYGMELRSFKELLEKQSKWDTLKEIAFVGCEGLSEGTVCSLFEGKDVTWEE